MREVRQDDLDRRGFLKASLAAATGLSMAAVLLPGRTARAADDMVTDIESMKPMVDALQYVAQTTKPGEDCKVCQFYTPVGDGKGKCQLFTEGLVAENGHCASWVKKVS